MSGQAFSQFVDSLSEERYFAHVVEIKLLLKEKYGLVHVPHRRKVRRWVELTRSHMRTGQSPENAGLLAARDTFPYELREHNVYAATGTEELLYLYDSQSRSSTPPDPG